MWTLANPVDHVCLLTLFAVVEPGRSVSTLANPVDAVYSLTLTSSVGWKPALRHPPTAVPTVFFQKNITSCQLPCHLWCLTIFHTGLYFLGTVHIPAAFLSRIGEKQAGLGAT